MKRRFHLLSMLAVGALACAGCIDEDLLNPMANRQPRVNAYAQSDFYADELTMRQPPAGTVPRQRFIGNPELTRGKTTGPNGDVYATTIPMKVDRAFLDLGRKRYDITCGTCHGPTGDGDSIVARQMALRPPPSLLIYADRPPGYIYEVITNGFGLMASYAAELPVSERWAVVAYIRALQISQSARLASAPAEEQARLQAEPAQPAKSGQPAAPAPAGHKETP